MLRDLDLLVPMARERLVSVMISVTTLDRRLARRMEPRAVKRRPKPHHLLTRRGNKGTSLVSTLPPCRESSDVPFSLAFSLTYEPTARVTISLTSSTGGVR